MGSSTVSTIQKDVEGSSKMIAINARNNGTGELIRSVFVNTLRRENLNLGTVGLPSAKKRYAKVSISPKYYAENGAADDPVNVLIEVEDGETLLYYQHLGTLPMMYKEDSFNIEYYRLSIPMSNKSDGTWMDTVFDLLAEIADPYKDISTFDENEVFEEVDSMPSMTKRAAARPIIVPTKAPVAPIEEVEEIVAEPVDNFDIIEDNIDVDDDSDIDAFLGEFDWEQVYNQKARDFWAIGINSAEQLANIHNETVEEKKERIRKAPGQISIDRYNEVIIFRGYKVSSDGDIIGQGAATQYPLSNIHYYFDVNNRPTEVFEKLPAAVQIALQEYMELGDESFDKYGEYIEG